MKRFALLILALGAVAAGAVSLTYVSGVLPAAVTLVILALAALTLFGRQLSDLYRCRRMAQLPRNSSIKLLASLMGVCLASGALLYLRTFYIMSLHGDHILTGEYIVRSVMSSANLFMLDIDSDIMAGISAYPHLRSAISVQAVLSFSCTITLLLSIVFSRVRSYLRLRRRLKPRSRHNHLYVFFGCNEAVETLAADVCAKDPAALTVIVDESNVDSDDNDGLERIMGLFSHHRATGRAADAMGAVMAVASERPQDVDYNPEGSDIFGLLNLESIRKAISRLPHSGSDARLDIFFLSDDEDANIRAASAIAHDLTVMNLRNTDVECRLYAHARANHINSVVEDLALRRGLELRIVDSSRMAVEQLKADPKAHPVHYVHHSPYVTATVDSPFESLIIGFGEVGRDSLRFLYEFGAFVDSKSEPWHSVRSPWHATVVDTRADILEGAFRLSAPAAFMPRVPGPVVVDPKISFHKLDYRSPEFDSRVLTERLCRRLNYIVIAVGDARRGVELACSIFTRIRAVRPDLSMLRIMVHCPGARDELLEKIVAHHNSGYGRGRDNEPVINLFGTTDDIYTYPLVVGEELRQRAQEFHAFYQQCRDASATAEWRRPDHETWRGRRTKLTGRQPMYIFDPPVYCFGAPQLDKLRRLKRQESQDAANALHAATKIEILRRALYKGNTDNFFSHYHGIEGNYSAIRASNGDEWKTRLLLRLAMLEHLRWEASHIMAGYIPAPAGQTGCDERTRTHNCLAPWEDLDRLSIEASTPDYSIDYKLYDFAVVDSTIKLYCDPWRNYQFFNQ